MNDRSCAEFCSAITLLTVWSKSTTDIHWLVFNGAGHSGFVSEICIERGVLICNCSSAHYFWYITQTAFHAFRRDVIESDERFNSNLSDFLVLFINSKMMVKRIYRMTITILTISYMIYYLMMDFSLMLIVPAGEVPLILMWGLNITHLLGLFCFVMFSLWSSARQTISLPKTDVVEQENTRLNQSWRLNISIVFIQVRIETINDLNVNWGFFFKDYYSIDISTTLYFTSSCLVCVVYFLVNCVRSNMATGKRSMYSHVFVLLCQIE